MFSGSGSGVISKVWWSCLVAPRRWSWSMPDKLQRSTSPLLHRPPRVHPPRRCAIRHQLVLLQPLRPLVCSRAPALLLVSYTSDCFEKETPRLRGGWIMHGCAAMCQLAQCASAHISSAVSSAAPGPHTRLQNECFKQSIWPPPSPALHPPPPGTPPSHTLCRCSSLCHLVPRHGHALHTPKMCAP